MPLCCTLFLVCLFCVVLFLAIFLCFVLLVNVCRLCLLWTTPPLPSPSTSLLMTSWVTSFTMIKSWLHCIWILYIFSPNISLHQQNNNGPQQERPPSVLEGPVWWSRSPFSSTLDWNDQFIRKLWRSLLMILIIWIRCIEKHAGQRLSRTGFRHLWSTVKHAVKDVKGMTNKRLCYTICDDKHGRPAYSDSDWTSDASDRWSTTDYCFNLYKIVLLFRLRQRNSKVFVNKEGHHTRECSS